MLKTWKCLSGIGYIWTVESNVEKEIIIIKNYNDEIIFREENINQETLRRIEKHYENPDYKNDENTYIQ